MFASPNKFDILHIFPIACNVQHKPSEKDKGWIFYCGSTDTMTHDRGDFVDGKLISVEGSGTIEISPTLKLSNCLYVPKLSQKLMSISHVTKELNSTLLLHPIPVYYQDKEDNWAGH